MESQSSSVCCLTLQMATTVSSRPGQSHASRARWEQVPGQVHYEDARLEAEYCDSNQLFG